MKLSILMPVYNERTVVEQCIGQVLRVPLPEEMERELIVVDDCSTDGTSAILERLAANDSRIRLYRHDVNQGKGASVRDAVQYAAGEFSLIQDADLEYDPSEYPRLLRPLLEGHADAVFGSRYLAGEQTRVLPYWHSKINAFLTWVSNMFSNLNLTDMETCYKVFRTDLLKSIPIRSERFGIEPEITMKSAKRRFRIYEVPISYHGRTYEEGKKIGWRDGLKALFVIFHYWLIDDLYAEPYGRGYLNNLTGTPQYLAWMAEVLKPHVGDRVLEVGAGIGNLAARLLSRRFVYVVAEKNPLYLHALRNRFLRTPNVQVQFIDPDVMGDAVSIEPFDTLLFVNVLEYVDDPSETIASLTPVLEPNGVLLILAPQGPELFGSIDRKLGHRRRFRLEELTGALARNGITLERSYQFNKIGGVSWWLFGKVLGRPYINKLFLKLFDKTVWLWRRVDRLLPWKGLSLILVARKTQASGPAATGKERNVVSTTTPASGIDC